MGSFKSGTHTLQSLIIKNTGFEVERRHVNFQILEKYSNDYIVLSFRDILLFQRMNILPFILVIF